MTIPLREETAEEKARQELHARQIQEYVEARRAERAREEREERGRG